MSARNNRLVQASYGHNGPPDPTRSPRALSRCVIRKMPQDVFQESVIGYTSRMHTREEGYYPLRGTEYRNYADF